MAIKTLRSIAEKINAKGQNTAKPIMQIGNSSAIANNFLDAIEKLKKVKGNPTAVNSIGSQNYSQILSQLS